ncbi:hypothetical protein B0H16DRAFT_1573139 [Mycena metata]|uniref:F-box domain-containing protein n=1 Tax=Mycena metata TaxID=1033252 RepID=A0AAD7I919_9AGAR|nr:hypothetical protein B0H16DRAFT_1573139 [Mycena metata]
MKKVKVVRKAFAKFLNLKISLFASQRRGAAGKSSKVTKRQTPTALQTPCTYDVSDVPPELWAHIGTFASRQSLARLCAASQKFHSLFSPLLYGSIIDPPLNSSQSSALITALGSSQTPNRRLWHPAARIQQLSLTDDPGSRTSAAIKSQRQAVVDFLMNMYTGPNGLVMNGSVLRVLHWDLAAGLDDLGRIMGVPGRFPNLRELVVSTTGTNNNFNFIQIRGLEVLRFTLNLDVYDDFYDAGNKLCFRLAEALQMLPLSSPLLRTLQLKLTIGFDEDEFPYLGFGDLVDAINLVHLPALTTLDLSFGLPPNMDQFPDGPPDFLPDADFSPFLASHPTLLDLTLSASGTKLKEDSCFLPSVRFFSGSFEDAIFICAAQRELETLVLTFVNWSFNWPEFRTRPLATHLSLTSLRVRAVDRGGSVQKLTNELSPASLAQLATSFPNLTHLDICISERLKKYRKAISTLTKLEILKIQEYRTTVCTHFECYPSEKCPGPKRRATKVFPSAEYAKELSLLLPALSQVASIELTILGDHIYDEFDDDPDIFSHQMELNYQFSVVRRSGDTKIVVKHACVVSDTRHCTC